MQEEAQHYGFKNTCDFIRAAVATCGSRHYTDCGTWYGNILSRVESMFETAVGYEAVTEIAIAAQSVCKSKVINETLVDTADGTREFWLDPKRSLFTSSALNAPSKGLTAYPIGPQKTFDVFIKENRERLAAGVLKSNIEGLDLDLVAALIEYKVVPTALLFEVNGGLVGRLASVWPSIKQWYNLPLDLELDSAFPHHIGVFNKTLFLWAVGSDKRNSVMKATF